MINFYLILFLILSACSVDLNSIGANKGDKGGDSGGSGSELKVYNIYCHSKNK